MARRQRKGEVVCRCSAYRFPHRLLGGRCTGRGIVYTHWDEQQYSDCASCHFRQQDSEYGFSCEVVSGAEETHYCPALQEVLHGEEVPVPRWLGIKRWP